jgi:hypothetical protein
MPWLKAIGGALRLIPSWVWILLAAAAAWHFALAWHSGKVRALVTEAKRAQLAEDQAAVDAARARARAHKQAIETADAVSAEKARNDYAKDTGDLGAGYDELRRQPPPRVQPVGGSQGSLPGLSGDPFGAPATAEGKDARLFAGADGAELAVVNWPELLNHGQSCDVDRARLKALQDLVRGFAANHNPSEADNGK